MNIRCINPERFFGCIDTINQYSFHNFKKPITLYKGDGIAWVETIDGAFYTRILHEGKSVARFEGWAHCLSKLHFLLSVFFLIGERKYKIKSWSFRQDVFRVYNKTEFKRVGFNVNIPVRKIPVGSHKLKIQFQNKILSINYILDLNTVLHISEESPLDNEDLDNGNMLGGGESKYNLTNLCRYSRRHSIKYNIHHIAQTENIYMPKYVGHTIKSSVIKVSQPEIFSTVIQEAVIHSGSNLILVDKKAFLVNLTQKFSNYYDFSDEVIKAHDSHKVTVWGFALSRDKLPESFFLGGTASNN